MNAILGLNEMILRDSRDDEIRMNSESINNDDADDCVLPDFLYDIKEIDVDSGLSYCGDGESYIMVLVVYRDSAEKKAGEIETYWAAGDIKNTTIMVHALKSACRSIGALELGEFAARLEKAGNSGDSETLDKELGELILRYRQLAQMLEPLKDLEEEYDDN